MRQIRACRCLSVLAQSSPERVWPRSSGDSCYSWIKLQGFSTWRKPDPDQMNPRSSGWSKKRTLLCLCRLFHWRLSQKQINSSVYSSPSSAHNLCQCTAVSEKWLLSYQWIGPDKMEDSGSGWGCSKVCESKRKKRGGGTVRWKHKRLVLMCRAQQSRDSRGEERKGGQDGCERGEQGCGWMEEQSRRGGGFCAWRSSLAIDPIHNLLRCTAWENIYCLSGVSSCKHIYDCRDSSLQSLRPWRDVFVVLHQSPGESLALYYCFYHRCCSESSSVWSRKALSIPLCWITNFFSLFNGYKWVFSTLGD